MTKTSPNISPISNLTLNQPEHLTNHSRAVNPSRRLRWSQPNPTTKNYSILINRSYRMNNSCLSIQPNTDNTKYTNLHYNNTHNIDRKSTRLNSSHANISYAVFCL